MNHANTKDPQESGADMLALLERIALGQVDASPQQVRAAVEVLRYRLGEPPSGKKEAKSRAAKAVASKFQPMPPPPRYLAK